jgi:hypothetical protein
MRKGPSLSLSDKHGVVTVQRSVHRCVAKCSNNEYVLHLTILLEGDKTFASDSTV